MKRVFRAAVLPLALLLLFAGQAVAAQKATFVVLPFAVQGPQEFAYLERSIPQMLTSRLFWQGRVEPARSELPASVKPVSSESEAEKLRVQYKADYVVWGTVTVMGTTCSLDVRVRDKAGKVWPQVREAPAPQLMGAITGISESINREVFNRVSTPVASGGAGGGRINQMNPDIMVNQTTPGEVYLNPQFRYAGASAQDDSRLRSQTLNFSAVGMEVADIDGDGKNEVLLLSDHGLHAYVFESGQLRAIGEYSYSPNRQCISVRTLPHPSGHPWIIVNTVDSGGVPLASILTYSGGSFKEELSNVKWYLNVVKTPPAYRPVLIGQEAQPPRLFKGGVFEMNKQGKTLVPGSRLSLPSEANVFGFSWLPGSRAEPGSDKLVVLTSAEKLRTYNNKLNALSVTSEAYSGSALGFEIDPSMPGFQRDKVTMANVFYVPMRMVPIDLEQDGNWEMIVNRPISTASQIFDRYRYFPQSEIHSLFWDGTGLNLQWKTRRIKGSMVDYTVMDANNDGVLDLVTCINTHPGALGVKQRRTIVLLYPLDVSRVAPNTPADTSEIYD